MAQLVKGEVFDPRKPLFVARSFRSSGRQLERGQLFNWQKLSVSQRRVKQLFDQRKLTHSNSEGMNSEHQDVIETESMSELKAIAEAEGADIKRSKEEQRKAIIENRSMADAPDPDPDPDPDPVANE